MEDDEWLIRLRDRHDALIAERDECYDGQAPRGEIMGWIARHLEQAIFGGGEGDIAVEHGDRTIVAVWTDLVRLYQRFDGRINSDEYRTRIISMLTAFEYPIPTRVIAGVVGCHEGHARRFYWDDDEQEVREKEWARAQRIEQAPPALVERIRSRDRDRCLRCNNRDELVVHHVVPVRAGGKAEETNLVTLCDTCHRDVHGGSISSGEVVYDGIDGFLRWLSE